MDDGPLHVTLWQDGAAAAAPRALLVHGTMSWGTECFRGQRPLADRFRLELMDRRGFGRSPDVERSDYEVDAQDIAVLLGSGAHLVGHSYGAAGAMLAAARRPDAVHSLTLIEPSTLRVAEENPVAPLAGAGYAKLVVNGAWETAHPEYRAFTGEALMACGGPTP